MDKEETQKGHKKSVFKCKICKKKFTERSGLTHHVQLHASDKPFECTTCLRTFKTKKYLSTHEKKVHGPVRGPQCNYCGKRFHYLSRLNEHLVVHTDAKPHKCDVCGKGFNSMYSLSTHNLIHTDSKPFKCSYCDYACRDSSTLRKHEERHLGIQKYYECNTCGKCFKTKSGLKIHVTEIHLEIDLKTKPCEECGKLFKSTSALTTHVKTVHQRKYESKCDICGVTLSNRYNMTSHLRSHVDMKPFRCSFAGCDKRYKDKSTLKKHSIIHYPEKQFPCRLCGKRFTRRERYRKHKRMHLPRTKNVVCDYCGASFYNKNYIRTHILKIHSPRQRYECDACGFTTHNKSALIRHVRRGHGALLDRQCKICHKTYKKHLYLKLHYWNTHFIKYKMADRPKHKKQEIVIKEELSEVPEMEVSDLITTVKVESVEADSNQDPTAQYSEGALAEEADGGTDELDIFGHVVRTTHAYEEESITDYLLDEQCEEKAQRRITSLLVKARRKKRVALERVRTRVKKKKKKYETPEAGESAQAQARSAGCSLNTHQCYVCLQLFETKDKLLEHCQDHFDVCNETILKKCPLCEYVTKRDLARHVRIMHGVKIKIGNKSLRDRRDNNNKSRFYYNLDDKVVKEIEVIPSVKNLNREASVAIDKRKRESNMKGLQKTKLIKKNGEWIVQKYNVKTNDLMLPDLNRVDGDGDYLAKIKAMSVVAKNNGKKILFPCDKCEKVCQNLSALKLHYRKHEDNPKPYKPKVWKHKLKGDEVVEKKIAKVNKNRYEDPKPIVNKHKCDPKLKEFYEKNIKGGDIEFWQFLKIYNKMSRENINDFSDLESRTEFGVHLDHRNKMAGENVEPQVTDNTQITDNIDDATDVEIVGKEIQIKKPKLGSYKRVIRISRKQYEKRKAIIERLRQEVITNKLNT